MHVTFLGFIYLPFPTHLTFCCTNCGVVEGISLLKKLAFSLRFWLNTITFGVHLSLPITAKNEREE